MLAQPACPAAPTRAVGAARPLDSSPVERFRALSLWLVAGTCMLAVLLVLRSGASVDARGIGIAAQLLAAALLASAYCWTTGRFSRFADLFGAVGLAWLAGLAGGLISLLGLQFHRPLADPTLLGIDRWLGIDTPALAAAFAAQPQWHSAVVMAYNYTVPLLCLSVVAHALMGRRVETWRAIFCFVGSLVTVCLVSIFTPAKGLGLWLSDATLAQLPGGAARYFWPSFDHFYGTANPVLSLAAIDGVVSFPSFHTAMGLIAVTLWRHSPIGLGLAAAWFVLMLAGTVPLGGHYVIDLIGGGAIWAAWFTASRRITRL